jgi:two-component system LytT family response regulator
VLKHDGFFHFVDTRDIMWLAARGDFVEVRLTAGSHSVRRSLSTFDDVLDPQEFVRIHRSFVVARSHIDKVRIVRGGEYAIVMRDATELRVSRLYSEVVRRMLFNLSQGGGVEKLAGPVPRDC